MHISIVTLFPEMFDGVFGLSILKRAKEKNLLTLDFVNIRDFANDAYRTVDDHPYGGGQGMILRVDVVSRALTEAVSRHKTSPRRILLDAQGKKYTQKAATKLSTLTDLVFICAHYEGIDERIRDLVDEEISIGDYILTGGEIAAMAVVDSIVRLIPNVLTSAKTTEDESFSGEKGLLEYPQYTRPETYNGASVPPILLSGNHANIKKWRNEESLSRTKKRRPDLLSNNK